MQNLTELNREQNARYTDRVQEIIKTLKKSKDLTVGGNSSTEKFTPRSPVNAEGVFITNNFCDDPKLYNMNFKKDSTYETYSIMCEEETDCENGKRQTVFLPWKEDSVNIMRVNNSTATMFSTSTLNGCSVYMLVGNSSTCFIHCNYKNIVECDKKKKDTDFYIIKDLKKGLIENDAIVKGVSTAGSRIILSRKFDEEVKDKYKGNFLYKRKYLDDEFRYSKYSKTITVSERRELNEKYNYDCDLYKESKNVNQLERITIIGVFEDSRWLLFATATKQMAYLEYENIFSRSKIHTQDKTMVFEITGIDEFKRADNKLNTRNILWKDW